MTERTQQSQKLSQESFWSDVLAALSQTLSEQTLRAWFEPVRFVTLAQNILTLEVPDKFYGDWLREHYEDAIVQAVLKVGGKQVQVRYQVTQKKEAPERTPSTKRPSKSSPSPKPSSPQAIARDFTLNYRYNFDNFVVGPGNRFAHAAAIAVTESPARAYNPLFIYGSVGLGKTHLLQAIAHETLKKNPDTKVVYISSEKFTNQLITAILEKGTQAFREKYRNVDMLLVDDIPFIANKEATQEEFFHTFNALYDAHKQIVVTSDRPPKDISSLEERLVSRFEWGLVTDIQPPDLETRIAILRKKLESHPKPVPDEVTLFIASRIKSNIRELEGALIRVLAYSSLTDKHLDAALAQEVLKDSLAEEVHKINIDMVQKRVAEYFDLSVSDMRVKKRTKAVAYPRQIAMYLVRQLTEHSLPEIGEYFGGRDHTTVLHAVNKIESEIKVKGETKKLLDLLVEKIRNGN